MKYPRVLVVAGDRINAADISNNGLVLRNLFGAWPRENLAQIFSSGDNSDKGFLGSYYKLGPRDRRLGYIFYRLKMEVQKGYLPANPLRPAHRKLTVQTTLGRYWSKRILVDTGLYELIFRPIISRRMMKWVNAFQPEIILAQGYNLAFTWLPLMLAEKTRLPIAYYPTDDWPTDLYLNARTRWRFLTKRIRSLVESSSRQLVQASTLRLAFNPYMQEEYNERYGRFFFALMHGDALSRFKAAKPHRLTQMGITSIVCTGVFDTHRMPLLRDLDEACQILANRGLMICATVLPVNFPLTHPASFKHLHFKPCPSHDDLASILIGADILFLPERFDETAKDIRLSISSKALLFMLSGRPIVVYSDPSTGIAHYARQEGWAEVVDRRDPEILAATIEDLIKNAGARERLSARALLIARKYHDLKIIQAQFHEMMSAIAQHPGD